MVFSSMVFLWVFLPAVLTVDRLLSLRFLFRSEKKRIRAKNIWLLTASLIFYAWGGPGYLILMLSVIVLNYAAGKLTEVFPDKTRLIVALAVVCNLLLLGYFKYFNLLVSLCETLTGHAPGDFGIREVMLPVGISFYIFQAMSYTIDVGRGKCAVQRRLLDFALYVSLFPQLIAGPIVLYRDIAAQLAKRRQTPEKTFSGILRFMSGLCKKAVIANAMAQVADEIFATPAGQLSFGVAWLGMIAYTMQIYYDFSGYSDMAIGLGRMLGFSFRENFDLPYAAKSIRDFWRRWHISLSSWFRDYVYIPLGGNRRGKVRVLLNLFLTFLLTGIWHGAGGTFVVWGLYHGCFLILERTLLKGISESERFVFPRRVLTFLVVMAGWVIFRAETLIYGLSYLTRLFAPGGTTTVLQYGSMRMLIALCAALFFSGLFSKKDAHAAPDRQGLFPSGVRFACLSVLTAYAFLLIVSGSYNPFIYYRF